MGNYTITVENELWDCLGGKGMYQPCSEKSKLILVLPSLDGKQTSFILPPWGLSNGKCVRTRGNVTLIVTRLLA